jgi:hypothetical protein
VIAAGLPYQALVWLLGPRDSKPRDIGLKALDLRPALNGDAAFEHFGRVVVGRIERLDPVDWEPSLGVLPKIFVVER